MLRISTVQEKPLEASKWLHLQFLLDFDEMSRLFEAMGPCFLYSCGKVFLRGEGVYTPDDFLHCYQSYIESLKSGQLPPVDSYQQIFSTAISTTPDSLYAVDVGEGRQLIRIAKPVIQMQPLTVDYSTTDKKFRTMGFGMQNIPWGLQCSFPQICQDPVSKQIIPVRDPDEFPNLALFRACQKWVRHETIPTPFLAEGTKTNVPMRIGHQCLHWINRHPSLIAKQISVHL